MLTWHRDRRPTVGQRLRPKRHGIWAPYLPDSIFCTTRSGTATLVPSLCTGSRSTACRAARSTSRSDHIDLLGADARSDRKSCVSTVSTCGFAVVGYRYGVEALSAGSSAHKWTRADCIQHEIRDEDGAVSYTKWVAPEPGQGMG